jgi:hypothetical protein
MEEKRVDGHKAGLKTELFAALNVTEIMFVKSLRVMCDMAVKSLSAAAAADSCGVRQAPE